MIGRSGGRIGVGPGGGHHQLFGLGEMRAIFLSKLIYLTSHILQLVGLTPGTMSN